MSSIVQLSLFDGKVCRICLEYRPLEEFYLRSDTGRRRSECTDCFNAIHMQRYEANRDEMCKRMNERYHERKHDPAFKRQQREQWAKHRDKALVKKAAYRAARREELSAKERERYRQNPQRTKDNVKRWNERNPEKYRRSRKVRGERRRARKAQAPGFHTPEQWAALCNWFGNVCLRCGKPETTIDHVMPLSKGGSDSIDNLQPLCLSCNSGKHHYADYRDPERLAAFLETL